MNQYKCRIHGFIKNKDVHHWHYTDENEKCDCEPVEAKAEAGEQSEIESVARALARAYWQGRGETITKEQEDEFWLSWGHDAEKAITRPAPAAGTEGPGLRVFGFRTAKEWRDEIMGLTILQPLLFERTMEIIKCLADLEKEIGTLPAGAHPDEIHPRGETWLAERENWRKEVEGLRAALQSPEPPQGEAGA